MEKQKKSLFKDLWYRTMMARRDPLLVQIVHESASPGAADKAAEELDYPTYLCRETRLLAQMRQHYPDAWSNKMPHAPVVAPTWPRTHEYPCEWEVEHYHGSILGTHAGTLVVNKSAHNAAVLWDYALLDEDGKEVCHSWDLGQDWYLREGLLIVNCHLNSGSRLLPRNGLTISFSALCNRLDFKRTQDQSTIWWTRLAYQKGDGLVGPYISRRSYGTRQQEHHEVVMKPLSPAEMKAFSGPTLRDPWVLFLEKSFLQNPHGENSAFMYSLTAGYIFSGEDLLEHMQNPNIGRAPTARKIDTVKTASFPHRTSSLDVAVNIVPAENLPHCEETYQPHEQSTESVILRIARETPPNIKPIETVVRMCDLLRTNDYIYGRKDWPVSLLVST